MPPTNEFLPFCPTDTGTNLLDETDYTAAADRVSGNKPGIASAKLNNKALRQASYIASQVAQFTADQLGENVMDDATPAKLLAQFMAVLKPYPTKRTVYAGSGTHNLTFIFFIASGSATAAATYTNNGNTFTVVSTVASGTVIQMTGNGAPLNTTGSATLTKASGTGDATLTFYAYRAPIRYTVQICGGGGGGGGAIAGTGGAGADGGNSAFGAQITADGGVHGGSDISGGTGGAASLGTGPIGVALAGSRGSGSSSSLGNNCSGGDGGSNAFGGAGKGAFGANTGFAAVTGTGGGGGGGGAGTNGVQTGSGGGAGGYVNASIPFGNSAFAYSSTVTIGAGGAGGTGTGSVNGAAGADGKCIVEEEYQ